MLFATSSLCLAQQPVLWRDPGAIERIDFAHAAGHEGPPRPPFRFVEERLSGNSPKVIVIDSLGVRWRVKGGREARPESFATRLVSALGYYAAATWFLPRGTINDVRGLTRAKRFISADGRFTDASFERQDPDFESLSDSWAWTDNPFTGTNQLGGLKVVVMLLADWDNKDERDRQLGSNTGTFGRATRIYGVSDWGQSLGGWGPKLTPNAWNCDRYTVQTKAFAKRESQRITFGFTGHHTDDFKNDITVENVRWLMRYLGRVSDAQLRAGLRASGATPREVTCFAGQLRRRIRQLQSVTRSGSPPPA